jgi:arylsulfatase A-like enzyme/Tfp pilus assembly protein PilF
VAIFILRLWFCVFLLSSFACAENLLLITVDTLRADHLSCYGYRANRTTNIDRWAAEGVLFERAYAEVPLTLPSHCTLLTGTLPFYHGVRDNVGYALPESQTTLAEVLRARGYATGAFIGAYVLASRFGTGQGFETFDQDFAPAGDDVISGSALRRSASDVTDRFLRWLQGQRDRRFFAWVHFYDPHAPYPEGYDRQISQVDQSIGAIDASLKRWNLLDTTHIFLVADHGESLGEHGESAHGFFVYDSTLRVPWIVRPAKNVSKKENVVKEAFSLLDVLPTALQLLQVPVPRETQGSSALGAMLGKASRQSVIYAESYLPQLQFGWSLLRSLRLDRYKFIEAPRPEFYDTISDPGETNNLFAIRRSLALRYHEQLQELLRKYQTKNLSSAKKDIDRETAQRLAALGYVAASTPVLKENRLPGPDPKDKIAIFEQYNDLLAVFHRGTAREITERIDQIKHHEPQFRALSFLEALAAERFGHLDEAVENYRQVLAENPENTLARANLANLYLRLGRVDAAEREFLEVLLRDPGDYRSRNNLALIYRKKGNLMASLAELRKVVEHGPQYATGWLNLGSGLAQTEQWAEAEKAFRRASQLDRNSVAAHRYLARVLHQLGREKEAQAEMRIAAELERKKQ